jgi:hypothetical protein
MLKLKESSYTSVRQSTLNMLNFSPYFLLQKVVAPAKPKGAERLPPNVVVRESDLHMRRLWGHPREVADYFTVVPHLLN